MLCVKGLIEHKHPVESFFHLTIKSLSYVIETNFSSVDLSIYVRIIRIVKITIHEFST